MNLFYFPDITDEFELDDFQEVAHINRVLRKKEGDTIFVTNGRGNMYECEIRNISSKRILLSVLSTNYKEKLKPYLHIAVAPTKNMDRMEWFVEKATELGVDEITFIITERSERKEIKNYDRLHKISFSALKQSKNTYLPVLNPCLKLDDFLNKPSIYENRYVAHCSEVEKISLDNNNKNTIILIGPEGDFTSNEIKKINLKGYKNISLGANILRTETAAISAAVLVKSSKK